MPFLEQQKCWILWAFPTDYVENGQCWECLPFQRETLLTTYLVLWMWNSFDESRVKNTEFPTSEQPNYFDLGYLTQNGCLDHMFSTADAR